MPQPHLAPIHRQHQGWYVLAPWLRALHPPCASARTKKTQPLSDLQVGTAVQASGLDLAHRYSFAAATRATAEQDLLEGGSGVVEIPTPVGSTSRSTCCARNKPVQIPH